jgi:hypothetical protein
MQGRLARLTELGVVRVVVEQVVVELRSEHNTVDSVGVENTVNLRLDQNEQSSTNLVINKRWTLSLVNDKLFFSMSLST